MAITILSSPGTHTPTYNNQFIVASSTNSGQTNFKYKVTVEINNGYYNQNTTFKIPARPDNSKLYFDPKPITRNYITSPFHNTETDFIVADVDDSSELKKVTIGIDEEYGSPVSAFSGVSSSYYIWNASYNNIDFADFVYATSSVCKDLTLSPSLTDTIHYDQKYLMKAWHRGFSTGNLRYMRLKCYDSSGSNIQTAILENVYYDTSNPLSYFRNWIGLNCSPYGFNNITGGAIVSQSAVGLLVPTTTSYYTIEGSATNFGTATINMATVYIDDYCSKYNRYVLHFLNRLGNYDSFTFNLLSRYKTDKETSEYKKIPYSLNASNVYRYEKYTNDTVTYNTVLTNKWTLNTDWINDAQATWLRDLFASPEVRLEIPDDANTIGDQSALIAVKCTLKSYETKQQVNDKSFNFVIEIENALQDVRQGG